MFFVLSNAILNSVSAIRAVKLACSQLNNSSCVTQFPKFRPSLIVAVGINGGVKKFRMSLGDMTNKNELKSVMDLKKNNEAFKKAAEGATKELPKPEQTGLMSAPVKEEVV